MYLEPQSARSLFFQVFGMWGKIGIDCFVLITGWFMCLSHITVRKFLKLILEIEFYNIVLSIPFLLCNYEMSLKGFVQQLIPIRGLNANFTGCYIVFFLLIPFLNIVVNSINKKGHLLLMLVLVFSYSILPYLPLSNVTYNYLSWFVVLYIIASFLRKYPESVPYSNSVKFWGIISILSVSLCVGSVILWNFIPASYKNVFQLYWGGSQWWLIDCNGIGALITSISSFLFFKNLKLPQNRFINAVASTTFGVLLIHANSYSMRVWLWQDVIRCTENYYITHYCVYAVGSVLCVYIVCSLMDYLRINTIEKWIFAHIDKYIDKLESVLLGNLTR